MSNQLYEYILNSPTINTHSHYKDNKFFEDFDLEKLLKSSYIAWSGVDFDNTTASKVEYLSKVKYKSYFYFLEKSLKLIYNIDKPLSVQTWEEYDNVIKNSHENDDFRRELLSDKCKYKKIIMDAFWNPGYCYDDDIFLPTLRIDPLFFGYSKDAFTVDNTNIMSQYHRELFSLDDAVNFAAETIARNSENGTVALKSAIAYERDLNFTKVDRVTGQKVFNYNHTVREHIYNYQNYIMYEVCKLAAWKNMPLQIHTGLGCMQNTNASQLNTLIKDNPDTTFVLFHGSFPWTDDIIGLLHTYSNVYADICWLPLLSPTAAKYTLHQMIEVATADKITWGCDTATGEESLSAKIAVSKVLGQVLDEKINDGYLSDADAKIIADNIMKNNAEQLYKL